MLTGFPVMVRLLSWLELPVGWLAISCTMVTWYRLQAAKAGAG